jgi:glutathione S-transferase
MALPSPLRPFDPPHDVRVVDRREENAADRVESALARSTERRDQGGDMITCYAFAAVPPFAQGLVRDLRVRWALEEAGLPYRVKLVGGGEGTTSPDDYRKIQPFGQIPVLEDGDLRLFESGAIVLHVAARSEALLPRDGARRAHVQQWTFAALNTIEPAIQQLAEIDLFHPDERWAKERRPGAVDFVRRRLDSLAPCLASSDHLVGEFTAADVLMTTVLRILRHTDLLDEQPVLAAYKARCEARPAFQKALAGQMAAFAS